MDFLKKDSQEPSQMSGLGDRDEEKMMKRSCDTGLSENVLT